MKKFSSYKYFCRLIKKDDRKLAFVNFIRFLCVYHTDGLNINHHKSYFNTNWKQSNFSDKPLKPNNRQSKRHLP